MQNSRMYGISDTYDTLQMMLAVKKESDAEKKDQVPESFDRNTLRLPQQTGTLFKDIRGIPEADWIAANDPRGKGGQGRPGSSGDDRCADKHGPRLHARWEHIEGVGLRCTWVDEEDDAPDSPDVPEAGAHDVHGGNRTDLEPDARAGTGADTDPEANRNADVDPAPDAGADEH
ncbi:hypothetical protein LMG29739_01510 [Paraburkholderia solisilvae]|uniref:Uncharacterized protein n=2 Tax=Paraburkholderia solisilvae TaxID=624376 RepID=A0A6J5DDK6_9BURK|nr:hypothetical protein LMG29739_01510 [Paraburkholderia solisilvae]